TDITVLEIDAMTATIEMGNPKGYNMILLGALIEAKKMVSLDAVLRGLKKALPERHHHLIPANEAALRRGQELARN
ncbi:MAG: 2-oxoacid:acceptor oxidoreductase family protein, partial [Muribaculaceae bacterium]|nr:2-oxoacid:acceptor oxidoreductase family protein [Muribaculaceae bacterium]